MNPRKIVAECFFLDVGQGTSNVLLLGDGRAIVIDCGPRPQIPLSLLKRYANRIVALIVSHNDRDHLGGASAIVAAYPHAIDRIYFLQDRPIRDTHLYAVVKDAMEMGQLTSPPLRLERGDEPLTIYRDEEADLSLELLFPSFTDNLAAQDRAHPNETSGVLALFCGRRSIVFAGDSTVDNWQKIRSCLGSRIQADVLAVPHHGGHVVGDRNKAEDPEVYSDRVAEKLRWLYQDAVHPRHAIVSTGTSNRYGHPYEATIHALCECGATVLCTQVTYQCHSELESLRPGVISPTVPSASFLKGDFTTGGNSRNLACASTVISEIGPDVITIRRLEEHQAQVDAMANMSQGLPLCRETESSR